MKVGPPMKLSIKSNDKVSHKSLREPNTLCSQVPQSWRDTSHRTHMMVATMLVQYSSSIAAVQTPCGIPHELRGSVIRVLVATWMDLHLDPMPNPFPNPRPTPSQYMKTFADHNHWVTSLFDLDSC